MPLEAQEMDPPQAHLGESNRRLAAQMEDNVAEAGGTHTHTAPT